MSNAPEQAALAEQAAPLPELVRPVVVQSTLTELAAQLQAQWPGLRCDRLIGRNVLTQVVDRAEAIAALRPLLADDGALVLAETIPRHSQRIVDLMDPALVDPGLMDRWQRAEAAIAQSPEDPRFNWDARCLTDLCHQVGLSPQVTTDQYHSSLYISLTLLQRWFTPGTSLPSYRDQLAQYLPAADLATIQASCQRQLSGQTVPWKTAIAYLLAIPSP